METTTFAELGLSAKVQQAIIASGYTTPTPIQAQAIPVAMAGRDVLGIAQTGTGKTASFTLPMISRLETGRARARMPRSLILAPTRELAAQVAQSFEKYGVNHKLDVALLIGGVSMDEQTKKLDRGVDVLIATPGRLMDHFQRGRVMLMGVEILVIDEADRMLDMGFIPDIEKICKLLPPKRQSLFFSATMPAEITRLVHQFQNDPVRVEVAPPATSAKTITQAFAYCPTGDDWAKRETLRTLLKSDGVRNAIIFCNRKVEVAILLKSLLKHGFNAGAIHGDMDQKARMDTLDKFRNGEIAFLVGSDVAARGLDIPDVSHVFNFDLPRDKDDYVHRIGRTGRAGKSGHAYSLVTPYDMKQLQEIQKMVGEPATWLGDAPTEQDYADAGKKKRGRAGTTAKPGSSSAARPSGTRERPMPGRGRAGEPGKGHAEAGSRPAGNSQRRSAPNPAPASRSGAEAHDPQPSANAATRDAALPPNEIADRGPERAPNGGRNQHVGQNGGQNNSVGRGGRRSRPFREDDQPVRREVLNTGQRRIPRDGPQAPGLEPQPDVMSKPQADASNCQPIGERQPDDRRQSRGSKRGASDNGRGPNQPRLSTSDQPVMEGREPHAPRVDRQPDKRSRPNDRPNDREARPTRDSQREAPQMRQDARHDELRSQSPRKQREPQPEREPQEPRAPVQGREAREPKPTAARPAPQGRSNSVAAAAAPLGNTFADNVPAFLQRPVRPAKAASD